MSICRMVFLYIFFSQDDYNQETEFEQKYQYYLLEGDMRFEYIFQMNKYFCQKFLTIHNGLYFHRLAYKIL